ncbi:hypothetical protein S83_004197, partial [Arachis hypogaea]
TAAVVLAAELLSSCRRHPRYSIFRHCAGLVVRVAIPSVIHQSPGGVYCRRLPLPPTVLPSILLSAFIA